MQDKMGCLSYKRSLATQMVRAANRLGALATYGCLRRHLFGTRAAILMYHCVGDLKHHWILPSIRSQDFENQIRHLCEKHEIISLDRLVQFIQNRKPLPRKTVVITFDDGYKDNYLYAYPILKKYNAPATIFLTTGHIGSSNLFWWDKVAYAIQNTTLEVLRLDELGTYALRSANDRCRAISKIVGRLKELQERRKTMLIEKLVSISGVDVPNGLGKELILSWDEIREMSENGITFGAHTVTHPILTRLSLAQAKFEIIESKRHIEEGINHTVTAFSYPNGEPTDFNDDIKEILKQSGFTCAVTAMPKMITPRSELYDLGRISPGWNSDVSELFLSGLYSDLRFIWSHVGKLIKG